MFRWYVVNTYSGHENKVKANLEHRIESMGQRASFRRVVVPTEQVIETKDGQKVQVEKRILPGYVLVNMDLNDEAWTVVKNTPGVTGFVGSKPQPLPQSEVDRILKTGQQRHRVAHHHENDAGGRPDQGRAPPSAGRRGTKPNEGGEAPAPPPPLDRRDEDGGHEGAQRGGGVVCDKRRRPLTTSSPAR